MDEYDVVVVGAGPAGGQCARELSGMGHSVLLLERSKTIGVPNFSTAGTPNETMEVFDLPKKVTDCPWSSILFASKNERKEFVYDKTMGYVLNYKKMKQFLADEAEKKGADVVKSAMAYDVTRKGDSINGVKFRLDGEEKEARGKVVVDASGGRATLTQKLGMVKMVKSNFGIGIEHHMKNVELERKGRMEFYFGGHFAPGGYSWIFASGDTTAKVGVGIFIRTDSNRDGMTLLNSFAKANPQTKNAVITDTHGGSLFANGGIKDHVLNGFIAIGDAAVQINPLAGEGIRHVMYSGRFAADTIDKALQKGNFGKKNLSPYNDQWKKYVGNKWKISYMLQRFAYKTTQSDRASDEFIKGLGGIDNQTFFDIAFNYDFSKCRSGIGKMMKSLPFKLIGI